MRVCRMSRRPAYRAITYRTHDVKRAYYLSAEFLLGRAMSQNLQAASGLYATAERMLGDAQA
jgi:starch phosphorylase